MTLIVTDNVWFRNLNGFTNAQNRIESSQQRDM